MEKLLSSQNNMAPCLSKEEGKELSAFLSWSLAIQGDFISFQSRHLSNVLGGEKPLPWWSTELPIALNLQLSSHT